MGFLRLLKSLVDSEVMGEEIILAVERLYRQTKLLSPGDEPYDTLVKTYLARLKARGQNINNEGTIISAQSLCFRFACLREGENARALSLWCLWEERKDIVGSYPKFMQAYETAMYPTAKAEKEGTLRELFSKYNPGTAELLDPC